MDEKIEKNFKEFWVPIIFDEENGRLNLDQLKKELYDFSMLLDNVPKVYMAVTGGRISKPNTDAGAVIAEFEDYMTQTVQNEIDEFLETN